MAETKMTLREFCERYRKGDFLSKDTNVQIEAGWCHWFCEDEELSNRLVEIWKILDGITSDYILDNYWVRFSNDPSFYSPPFDSVYFEPINVDHRDKLCFYVSIDYKWYIHKYTVLSARTNYEAEAEFDNLEDVIAFINGWEENIKR